MAKHQSPKKKIISVVPSITELLFDLGLRNEVVGITKFCVHPQEWFHSKTRVGGTKELKVDLINALSPDLVIANREENTKEDIDAIAKFTSVYLSDIKCFDDALKMILEVGELVGRKSEAKKLTREIKNEFSWKVDHVKKKTKSIYFIWREPMMIAGGDTFISDMMYRAGFENAAANLNRYPGLSDSEISEKNPEILLLSSEPFPFKEKHIDEFKTIFPKQKIVLVDGEMFSWYGSRMKLAPDYFRQLHREIETYQ